MKSAAGIDKLNNNLLKNIGPNGINYLLKIINKSFKENTILPEWKIAKITMIPKKPNDSHNIDNYRPISLTCSIIKVIEKLVKFRLEKFLEENKIINKFQSGFRRGKSTIDNLFYFKQKCLEYFAQKMLVCGVIFDIEKAFDKVWHNGLFWKMDKIDKRKSQKKLQTG
ncbi:unnamed protein product [Brachionus calyciflorus]|uniref:Reverse transcriptase domain-containing protein n=1 Tax=Brachionus calyciflorus TaxID=104777 RepID=A0A814PCG5_9BILA|nr:unnamed protein product [Brachionus calyciflorus]